MATGVMAAWGLPGREQSLPKLQGTALGDSGSIRRSDVSGQLWCVHIEGLDDFIAATSQEVAQQEASAINAYIERSENGRRATPLRAVAIEWPFTPASHARSLVEDWCDLQRMPHRQASANPPHGVFANMARRIKELMAVARGNY